MKNDFLNLYSETNVGNKRPANEDFLGYSESPNGLIYVVCDGMGGHVGGATASQLAVNSILEFMSIKAYENIYVALSECIIFANQEILNKAVENPDLNGMGTTCTVIVAREPEIFIAHVGDSRIYLQRNDQLYRLTKDHSFVQDLVDQGVITDEETETHPRKNQILKALGISSSLEPSVHSAPIHPTKGDKFLMCTDGLNGEINDEKINSIFNSHTEINKVGEELIKSALDAGGKDNVTLEIIEVLSSPFEESVFPNYNPVSHLKTDPENNDLKTTIIIEKAPKNLKAENNNLKMILAAAFMVIIVGVVLIFLNKDEHKLITNEISLETEQTVENTNEAEKQDDSTDINSEDNRGNTIESEEEAENGLINIENSNNPIKKNKEKPKSKKKKKTKKDKEQEREKIKVEPKESPKIQEKDNEKERILKNANSAVKKANNAVTKAKRCSDTIYNKKTWSKTDISIVKSELEDADSLIDDATKYYTSVLKSAKEKNNIEAENKVMKAKKIIDDNFQTTQDARNKLNRLKNDLNTKLSEDQAQNSDTVQEGTDKSKKEENVNVSEEEKNSSKNDSIAIKYLNKAKVYLDEANSLTRKNNNNPTKKQKVEILENVNTLLGEINSLEEKFHSLKNYEKLEKHEKFKTKINNARKKLTLIK